MRYPSHRSILELWKGVNHSPATESDGPDIDDAPKKKSWLTILAEDIDEYLGGGQCDYFTAYRWYNRDSIPLQYHCAIVHVAARRGFRGVTHRALAQVKDISPTKRDLEAVA